MQRRALGFLFLGLALVFVAVTGAALGHGVRGGIVAIAALALAVWLASLGLAALRRRR